MLRPWSRHREHAHNAPIPLGMRAIVAALSRTCHRSVRAYPNFLRYDLSSHNYSQTGALRRGPVHHVQSVLREPQRRLYHADRDNSTIYALSTAPGRAAIAVIRISGPACKQVSGTQPTMSCHIAEY